MRITYLKLVNFIGIQHGLGTDTFEISFPDNGHKFIKLSGKNGSGKTTILSQLHPFKDSFDERKSLIIPGQEGRKIIEIEANGHEYKIEHIYRKAASSFFYKDGTLLNENGSVGECENLIEQELGINKDYFKIGKIGSNTANFIDLLPTERKKYIGTFITQIDKYIDAYEIANSKYKTQKNKIAETSETLAKYQNPEALAAQIAVEEQQLTNIETNITETSSKIAVIENNKSLELEKIKDINYEVDKNKLSDLINKINKENNAIETFELINGEMELKKVESEINKTEIETTKLNSKIDSLNEKIKENKEKEVSTNNSIAKNTAQLNSINLGNYDEVVSIINESTTLKAELENKIKENKFYSQVESCKDRINSDTLLFKNLMSIIYDNFEVLNENTILSDKKNIDVIFMTDYKSVLSNYSAGIKSTSENIKNELSNKQSEKAKKESNLDQLAILEKRPVECKIDTCPFIVNALKFKNLPDELAILENDIEKLKTSDKETDEKIEDGKTLFGIFSQIIKAFKAINSEENVTYKYFVENYGNITSQFNSDKNTFFNNYTDAINVVSDSLSIFNDYNKNEFTLNSNIGKKELMDNSKKQKEFFENENKSLNEELSKITDVLSELNSKKEIDEKELLNKNNYLELLKNYKTAKETINELNSEKEKTENNIKLFENISKIISGYNSELNILNSNLNSYKAEKTKVTEELNQDRINMAKITELKKNLDELNREFGKIKLVADALNPKSGIPLVFIKSYLDEVERISNNLLDLAYGGKFEIKFNVTDKEFLVTVRTNDTVISDIKFASQGEVALTTISISLALIERSISNYNIITLDEIDGPLDVDNRSKFINILTSQIEKLGLEQIFIISHNNAFDACSMDLILLKDAPDDIDNSEYMTNKTILYKY